MSAFTCKIIPVFRSLIQLFKYPIIEGILQCGRSHASGTLQTETFQAFRSDWACCKLKLRICTNRFRAAETLCMCPFYPRKIINVSAFTHRDDSCHNKFNVVRRAVKPAAHVSVVCFFLFLRIFIKLGNPFRKGLEATAFRAEIPFGEPGICDSVPVFAARRHSEIPYSQ